MEGRGTMKLVEAKTSIALTLALIVILFLFPVIIGEQTYILHIFILIFIFSAFGQSWNLLAGFAGQVSLGHQTFFGVGAYTLGLFIYYYDFFKANPWSALILGGSISVLVGLPIGAICFRLRGPYFALATLAVSEVMRLIILNSEFTLAGRGVIIPTPPAAQFGILTVDFRSKIPYYYISLIVMLMVFCITYLIVKSQLGFKLLTIKGDEETAATLGISPFRAKLFALSVSAFFAGVVGALYAQYMAYIDALTDPGGVLAPWTGLDAILVSLIGGIGTITGPIIGSIIRIGLGEFLRVIFGWRAGIDLLVFGLVLMLIVLFFRKGIWGFMRSRIQAKRW